MVLLNDILPLGSGNVITGCAGKAIPAIIKGSTASIRCLPAQYQAKTQAEITCESERTACDTTRHQSHLEYGLHV